MRTAAQPTATGLEAAQPVVVTQSPFKERAQAALCDRSLRQSFRGAMDFLTAKRAGVFDDPAEWQALSQLGEHIRQRALSKLPDLLEQLEHRCQQNGIHVHWAESTEQANQVVHGILAQHQATQVVKGKSMVSEEMALNHYLAERGVACLESDMGEYIVQLAGETPSHIIMPAIHKSKAQIAALFAEHLPGVPYTEDVDALIQIGRQVLRQKFLDAEVGISGVNFAVAETGTLCLVENEGNGRMCTTVPKVHIAVMGIEKVVEKLIDVAPLYSLLTRSATGQIVSTYLNLINGPRRPGELDGPQEVHLVLLDNGRSQAFADTQLRATLQCIRCGACMNHCPVYARIGGHAYGTVYPGPIGQIISPHLLGLQATPALPGASSLCGACGDVCPVKIPIPALLTRLRTEAARPANEQPHAMRGQGANANLRERQLWRWWRWLNTSPIAYRLLTWLLSRARHHLPKQLKPWTQVRTLPRPAPKTLHELMRQRTGRTS
ncbi:L-lactate dehydrogenase complex protein LldF [Chitinivorax tropicus]|uniref:L-lactate dehydrogenase complex protein LldF n=1 Tax=Chitinivorax tropicus TaxID=714531 RepID=A0A840MFD4_9PROT|nr:LutB/LldF family L-lactate oxidation iron-sulfur protein [Chitinivorax tropicus]MBB5017974.1 L-lactate dehydrogenase complex protein LldF [Chitinivorax tropicus]